MRYEDAVKVWGAIRLTEHTANLAPWVRTAGCKKADIIVTSVKVEYDFDEGFACCGGSDPDCYCSFAESPSANVVITGNCANCEREHYYRIDIGDFDFVTILGEIVAAGGGSLAGESS